MGYLTELVNFGGEIMTRGEMIAILQAEGFDQVMIDRYLQGQEAVSGR